MRLPKVGTPEWTQLKEKYSSCSKEERTELARKLGYKNAQSLRTSMYYWGFRTTTIDKSLCPFYGKEDFEIGVSISLLNVKVTDQEKIDICTKCELRRCIFEDEEDETT